MHRHYVDYSTLFVETSQRSTEHEHSTYSQTQKWNKPRRYFVTMVVRHCHRFGAGCRLTAEKRKRKPCSSIQVCIPRPILFAGVDVKRASGAECAKRSQTRAKASRAKIEANASLVEITSSKFVLQFAAAFDPVTV